jgi:tetratricopeptide (TPR) repeat protein
MNVSHIASATLAILVLSFSVGGCAQTINGYASRAEALKGLGESQAERRADAVMWIAANGEPADEAVLRNRLTDDNPVVRRLAERAVLVLWGHSGDDQIDALMAKGADLMELGRLDEAIAVFSEVIQRKPAFAEGWSQRATARFLAGDLRRSLSDCDQVMKRNPNHFVVMSGYGQIYFRLEQYEKAISYWKRALQLDPNLEGLEDNIEIAEEMLAVRKRNMV